MNELKIFENAEFGSIRTVEEDGKILFCGNDTAKALGYARPADAITAHCKGVVVLPTPTNGGVQKIKFITEGDLYRLITHSKLPTAEKFESWVFDEVLPAIRKTGEYKHNKADDTLKIQIQQERSKAMLLNAQYRMLKLLMASPDLQKLSPVAVETLGIKAVESVMGAGLGEYLPEVEKTYSATEVGNALGITAAKVGKIANANGLKTEEYGVFVMDKSRYSSKEVPNFRYNEKGKAKIKELLGKSKKSA